MKFDKEHFSALISQVLYSAGIEMTDDMVRDLKISGNRATIVLESSDFEEETLASAVLGKFELTAEIKNIDKGAVKGIVSAKLLDAVAFRGSAELSESKERIPVAVFNLPSVR